MWRSLAGTRNASSCPIKEVRREAQTVSMQSHPGMEVPWMLMLSPLPPGHTLFYLLAQLPSSYFNYLLFPSSGVDTR